MMMNPFLAGANMMAAAVIGVFFWKHHRRTRERLFGYFAVAFLLLGIERVCLMLVFDNPRSALYLIRLAAFLLILFAIWDKNRQDGKR